MAAPRRPVRTKSGYVRVRVDARLAWGVDLHTGNNGQVHESVAGKDLIEPFTGRPDLDPVVAVEPHSRDLHGDLLVINRTITRAADGLGEIPAASVAPPTQAETTAINAALDHLGYTGPREIRAFTSHNAVRSTSRDGARAMDDIISDIIDWDQANKTYLAGEGQSGGRYIQRLEAADRMAEVEARWHHLPGGFVSERKLIKTHIQAVAESTQVATIEEVC
jgi:hypothetical protein